MLLSDKNSTACKGPFTGVVVISVTHLIIASLNNKIGLHLHQTSLISCTSYVRLLYMT